jgi:beta-lactamase class A
MRKFFLTILLASFALAPPAYAAPKKAKKPAAPVPTSLPAAPIDLRIEQMVPVITGEMALDQYFAPTFLNAVPAEQLKGIFDSLIAQYGRPLKVQSSVKARPNGSTVKLAFEKAVGTIEIDVETGNPGKVIGLVFSGFEVSGDTLDGINTEFKSLSGTSGFLLAELPENGQQPRVIASQNTGEQFAIGSTFKLYILAELASQVRSGERKWSDVVPLTDHSFSSAATQGWPQGSPVTLHTLAGWMVSVSDNGATDTLLRLLGREAVERKLATIGHSAPDKTLPFLSTVEAFAIKANPDLRARFLKADEAQQRDLIEQEKSLLTLDRIDGATIGGAPASIDTIEWFASPGDILSLMRNIHLQRDDRMMGILSINPGLGAAPAKNWQYVGYKGGSEPGVISMSYLLRSAAGKWYVATGSWNDTAKDVDQQKFAGLMVRLVAQAAKLAAQ